jgi:hypothetical protein
MAESLLAILKQGIREGIQDSRKEIREHEIKRHPERKNWSEQQWQFLHDLNNLTSCVVAAPIITLFSSFAYQSSNSNDLLIGNIFGLGAITMTGYVWYSYRKLRKSPFYR